MRPLNVSLDDYTYKLAKKKSNFSAWVRDKLREEKRHREAIYENMEVYKCLDCGSLSKWPADEKYKFCRNSRSCVGNGTNLEAIE